jgi:hypothetical protein
MRPSAFPRHAEENEANGIGGAQPLGGDAQSVGDHLGARALLPDAGSDSNRFALKTFPPLSPRSSEAGTPPAEPLGMKNLVLAFILLGTSLAAGDDAPGGPEAARRELHEEVGVSLNNLGLQNSLDLSWRWPLLRSKNPLLADAHLALGLSHALSPSYMRVGAWAEISPLSVLELRAGLEPTAYFGTFNSLMSFGSYADPFDNHAREQRGGAGFGAAGRAYLSPTLKMKAGPLVALVSADLEWWSATAAGPFFYEPARDTLLRTKGDRLLATSGVLLFERNLEARGTLSAGLIHQLTYVYEAPANRVQRLGVIMVREFGPRRFGLPNPRVIGILASYLDDPSKKHQLTATVALGLRSTR